MSRGGPLHLLMWIKQRVWSSSHKGCEAPRACQAAMRDSRSLDEAEDA
eukprot:CAMPEP_0172169528 /NCGR_PEP_ID=MMETSP1050-20130122/10753_1 /TAXON_ID=233186 /ORGANISM="Cryptomonas curvata, Strain CCAP979/52" /LENGTH=47 /DNA_ID= /DNA_START= /DNA_END= /DNA_ORIENTATION=